MTNSPVKKVSIIGLGYIGLPTAAILASKGVEVIGVDINKNVVSTINKGEIHIVEPCLGDLVAEVVSSGRLRATSMPEAADIFIIAVPTPFKENHVPDISFVEAAVKAITPYLVKDNLVILESTSPVGTTEKIAKLIGALRPDLCEPSDDCLNLKVYIAYCPERVLPGKVLEELVLNNRVIGGLSLACSQKALELYRTFVEGDCIISNARSAEMCKLTENAYRDVNIAFANELSLICDKLDINVWELIGLANRHPRVNILQPGPGVGGHCIAVDPWFIVNAAPSESKLIRVAREVNDFKPTYLIKQIESLIKKGFSKVAFFGMSYKPNVDDFRESPAIEIIDAIARNTNITSIKIVEPYAQNLLMFDVSMRDKIQLCEIDEAITAADVLILLVDHEEFKGVSANQLVGKKIIDSKGCWVMSEGRGSLNE